MKVNELKSKSSEELHKELIELNKEQFNLRMQRASGEMVKSHRIKQVRRDIARIKTIMKEKSAS